MTSYTKKISTNDFINNEYILKVKEAEAVYLQQENLSYSIQANIGDKQNWSNTSLINMSDYNLVSEIVDDGLYLIDVSGLDYIKIIVNDTTENSNLLIKVVGDLWQQI